MRLNKNQIIELLENNNILELGQLADEKRQEFHPDSKPVTFVIDRNVNYTNICTCKCEFCAFHKDKVEKGSYVLDYEIIRKKVEELVSVNGTQLLLQGGLNPDLPLEYYLELIKNLRKNFPDLTIHAFSPPEIAYIAKNNNLSVKKLLEMLIDCGLSSIPGGGAEILDDEIRQKISPNKISAEQWLSVMETAHESGLKTTATMVFGFGENYGNIANHLLKIRDLQDRTNGFTAFIPWTFAPFKNSSSVIAVSRSPERSECFRRNNPGKIFLDCFVEPQALLAMTGNTAHDYLKILAVSRLALDNIPNIQASWVTQGLNIAQLSLRFGANDFGGTMLEENVVRAAGVNNRTTVDEIVDNIRKAGFKAARRNTKYEIINKF